jgi:hypothetical protein
MYTHECMYVSICLCMCVYFYVCVYIYMYIPMQVWIYIYIYIYREREKYEYKYNIKYMNIQVVCPVQKVIMDINVISPDPIPPVSVSFLEEEIS